MSEGRSFLQLLQALDSDPDTNQRTLSKRLGIALGLTNTLLRRAAKQGYLRVVKRGSGGNRYELTDRGLVEKGRLLMDQLQDTLQFYAGARTLAAELLRRVRDDGIDKIAIAGTSNVSEVIFLGAREVGLEVVGFVDADREDRRWLDVRVITVDELEGSGADVLVLDALKREEVAAWDGVDFPKRSLVP